VDFSLFFNLLKQLALGIGIGFTIGLTGIGAGVLVVPSLIYIIGLSPVNAVGTGLLYSMLSRIYAISEHSRLGTIRKRTAFYIILGGVPAVLVASFLVMRLARIIGNEFDLILKAVIALVMFMTWILMLVDLITRRKSGSETYYVPPKEFPHRRKFYCIGAGAVLGFLIGSTSIGGGVFLIPVLAAVFRLSPDNTVGTSNLTATVMSAMGSLAYLLGGNVNLLTAAIMLIGSIPGIWFGCKLLVRIPHRVLASILFATVTVSMIVMLAGVKK